MLFITEGCSASGIVEDGFDNESIKYVGVYKLTGKFVNVITHKAEVIAENNHFKNLKNVLGLR